MPEPHLDPTIISPLLQADPSSIDLLFDTKPTDLTEAQLDQLVLELRRRRNAFASDEAAKQSKGKKATEPKPAVSVSTAAALDKPSGELTLDDLL